MTFPSTTARVAVAGAIGLAGLAMAAPAAIAGKNQAIDTKGGRVEFRHHGEVLYARDDRRDGYSVSVELALAEGLPLFGVTDGNGAHNSPNSDRYPLREGTHVQIRMCYLQDQWHIVRCSGWQRAQA